MRYFITLLLMGLGLTGFTQAPGLINYQGIARDSSGTPIANQNISVKFEILQGSSSGSPIYTDEQAFSTVGLKTNSMGLFNTQIGRTPGLLQVNWPGGPYYLQVSIDPTGGTAYTKLGAQQIVSVPFAISALSVPSTYSANVLTIGTRTHAINSAAAVTLTQGVGSNVTVSGGPNYTISSTPPVLALTANNASLSILGSNTIALPTSAPATLQSAGIATVVNSAPFYTVGVPPPTYNPVNGMLSFGTNNTLVTPTLVLNNSTGVVYSGVPSNSIALPSGVTVSGAGVAVVTGSPNFVVTVPQPSLALSTNQLSLSIIGSNSVALPAAVTVSAAAGNNLATVSGGPASYAVSVPYPSYNGTVLTIGLSTITVAPTLTLSSGGILSSGTSTNTVNLNNIGPWRQATGSVTLTTGTDNVGINTPGAPANKLEVWGTGSTTIPVVKFVNQNAANATAALDVASNGGLALQVTNNTTNGVAAAFSSSLGAAISAVNNSGSFSTISADNTDASSLFSYGGYFKGGLVSQGKNIGSGFSFSSRDFSNNVLFAVRNDGKVAVGTNAPLENFQVEAAGNSQMSLISTSNGLSNILFGTSGLHNEGAISYNNSTDGMSFWTNNVADRLFIDNAGNAGIGAGTSLLAKLDVNGNMRLNSGRLFLGAVTSANSGQTGVSSQSSDLLFSVFKSGAAGTTFGPAGNSFDPMIIKNTTGFVGIGTTAPSATLHVNGSASPGTLRITDGTEGLGKVLTSDAAGNAAWMPVSVTTATTFAQVSTANVTTIATNLGSLGSFTKANNDTKVTVVVQTHVYVGDLTGTFAVTFEVKLGTTSGSGNSGKISYFKDNNNTGSGNPPDFQPVTIIAEFIGVSAGIHNVNISASANTIGTASVINVDPGNFGTNSLIIREYR